MKKPRLLDLFCCEGGATRGYQNVGFWVRGVDRDCRRRYIGNDFIQSDALEYLNRLIQTGEIEEFDAVHASPPCQKFCKGKAIHKNRPWAKQHPDLIEPTRRLLAMTGLQSVLENIEGAPPLVNPIMLCGTMFDLRVYRHRLFECSFPVVAPRCRGHRESTGAHRGFSKGDGFICVAGHNFAVADAKKAMGIDWATQHGLSQAIPPAYTEYIGRHLLEVIERREAA